MIRNLDAEIDSIKHDISKIVEAEFKHRTYKDAATIIGIPESNYWRFINHGTIGGKTLFLIIGYLISRGVIFISREGL